MIIASNATFICADGQVNLNECDSFLSMIAENTPASKRSKSADLRSVGGGSMSRGPARPFGRGYGMGYIFGIAFLKKCFFLGMKAQKVLTLEQKLLE